MLTVVFERRPPSPSIQTSEIGHERTEHFGMSSRTRRTLSLDLFTLGEGEVGSKKIGTVLVGHGEEVGMYWRARGERWRWIEERSVESMIIGGGEGVYVCLCGVGDLLSGTDVRI